MDTPTCPHEPGTAEYAYWWENYLQTYAIPLSLAESRRQSQILQTLRKNKHFHSFDHNRRCPCGLTSLNYDAANSEQPPCPLKQSR